MSSRPGSDPLAPFEACVTFLSAVVVVLLAITIPIALIGSGSIAGIGDSEACAAARPGVVPYGERDVPGHGDPIFVPGLHADASVSVHEVEVCDQAPSAAVKVAESAGRGAELALFAGFLLLARRLIRSARRDGLFTAQVAARTRTLGWFLLLGPLAAAALHATADGIVLSSAIHDVGWSTGLRTADVPLTLVVVGLGVLTVSRMMRRAVMLQDEADATI